LLPAQTTLLATSAIIAEASTNAMIVEHANAILNRRFRTSWQY